MYRHFIYYSIVYAQQDPTQSAAGSVVAMALNTIMFNTAHYQTISLQSSLSTLLYDLSYEDKGRTSEIKLRVKQFK